MASSKKNTWLGHIETISSRGYHPEEMNIEGIEKVLNINDRFQPLFYHSIPATYLIDYRMGKYMMVSKSASITLGYNAQEFIDNGVGMMIDIYQKEDLKLFNEKIFPDRLELLKAIPPEEHANYIFSYSFRFKNKQGEYITLLQRNSFIKSDANGRPLQSLGMVTDITHYARNNPVIQMVEKVNVDGNAGAASETVFKKAYYLHEEDLLFSRREKEVLLWMTDGLTSKEIAGKTFLSEATIINHRKNMLLKSGAKNVAELIAFALKKNIL